MQKDPSIVQHEDGEEAAEITWLELFYDLVYVAAIIQLGLYLHDHLTPSGILGFAVLFTLLWWSWSGTTFFFNRCPMDNIPRRLLLFVKIFATGSMAIIIGGAFEENSMAFALTYAVARYALVLLYVRVYLHETEARPLVGRYALGFGIGATLWVIAAFVPVPYCFALWALALAVDLYAALSRHTHEADELLPLDVPRLSERYGQFVIILLGESFIKTVGGLSDDGLSLDAIVFSVLAFVFIVSIWWTYFRDVAGTVIRSGQWLAWVFMHLPLMVCIAAMGVGLEAVVQLKFGEVFNSAHRWLLYGAVALCYVSFAVLESMTRVPDEPRQYGRILARLLAAAAFVLLLIFGSGRAALLGLGIAVLICLGQIVINVTLSPRKDTDTRAHPEEDLEADSSAAERDVGKA